jgi:H+/gluconate symporter-like permease
MASFAVVIMGRLAARSRGAGAVLLAGIVAASFKLLDLLVPGTDILALANPIQAILLEALAAAVWVGRPMTKRGTVPLRGQSLIGRL